MTVDDKLKILRQLKELKRTLVFAQEYESGMDIRDMEVKYINKEPNE